MKTTAREPHGLPPGKNCSGKRHWFHITGLPGGMRTRRGMPTFGQADCAKNRMAKRPGLTFPQVENPLRQSIVWHELRAHIPFTALGTLSGVLVLGLLLWTQAARSVSTTLFWTTHPLHVLLSALVTTAMFRRHGGHGFWATVAVGYFGSVGIATLSDCLLPYVGETLLALPHRGLHLGFLEKWWLVNPLAAAGIFIGFAWPHTKFPHAGHVLLSTWASLFHITMALGTVVSIAEAALITCFLFVSVWLPCCTSDIVFPLLFTPKSAGRSDNLANTSPPRL